MNNKILIVGATAALVLAGCQNMTDQLGTKLAESMINSATNGEVKVNIEDLQNGKINVTTKEGTISMSGDDDGGSMKMTDASGKVVMDANGKDGTMTVTNDKGETMNFSGDGKDRPTDAPADLPSLDGATGFSSVKLGTESYTLVYQITNKDLKATCDQQTDKLLSAGWKKSETSVSLESADAVMRNYENDDSILVLSCGSDTSVGTTVTMQKNKKSA
ncbi:hypothetical protein IT411_00490 [Candidatus Peregrinibacteria bacterium]|nr:hypothetical protein [Candidatus Peregrinibacteria bacterium]